MQEHTWDRLREWSRHQGASHATKPTYFPAYLYISGQIMGHLSMPRTATANSDAKLADTRRRQIHFQIRQWNCWMRWQTSYAPHFLLVVLRFRGWNQFRTMILVIFWNNVIPIPILIHFFWAGSNLEPIPALEPIPLVEPVPLVEPTLPVEPILPRLRVKKLLSYVCWRLRVRMPTRRRHCCPLVRWEWERILSWCPNFKWRERRFVTLIQT